MADDIKVSKVSKKFGVSVRGPERHHQAVVDSTREFIKQFAKSLPDWKKEARGKQIKLDPDQNYCPAEVAAIINRSYDTALRLMKKLGASNLGTPSCGAVCFLRFLSPMSEIDKLVAYIRSRLTDLNAAPTDAAYEYASVPLCVIDAVFSIGVRYESTERTVTEFCERYHWQRDGRGRTKEYTVSEF